MSSQNSDLLSAEHLAAKKAWRESRAALPDGRVGQDPRKAAGPEPGVPSGSAADGEVFAKPDREKARQTLKDLERG